MNIIDSKLTIPFGQEIVLRLDKIIFIIFQVI